MKKFLTSFSQIKFVRDIATMQIGQIVTTGSGFLASILFARLLGLQGYGVYAIVLAFTGLLGFITNLGQQTTALTFFAEAYGKKDTTRMKEVLHYYLFLSACSALIMALLIPFLPWITDVMYGKPEIGALARIIFISSIVDPLFVFGSIVLQSVREIRKLTIIENSRIVVQLGLSVLFLLQGKGVEGVLLGTLYGTALMSVISLLMYSSIRSKYNLPSLIEIIGIRKLSHVWSLGKDGVWIAIDKNVGNLYPNLFLVVLGMFVQESVVGLFRLAFKLGNLPASFVLSNISRLSASVIPTLSSSGAGLKKSIVKLATYSSLIHVGATVGALLVVPPLIPLVYGADFSVAVYPFIVIAILHTTSVIHILITPILRLYSRIYIATTFNLVGLTCSLGAFFTLMSYTKITFALYIALGIYHFIIILLIIPTYRIVRLNRTLQR
ncbi:oligosaccharide flippase family protein [Candidatus Peregrinibacteria bacterium]|jgi:O-antigen/teichoic acid export membrane protein|nr:oligosaccharide flippase family protein [Candidatus Peregrinibacteria bacterium]MBT5468066.1 oligosaccharide flippase family protein [Candidatus Peregrinibacteria bacterium]MBT7337580.1 oligosaccharide flippase family protein [Candidatus Peregrinibacteria bacterium]